MRKLFDEGQRHSQNSGVSFLNDCYNFDTQRTGFLTSGVCGDSNFNPPYNPRMFPVRKFYDSFIMGITDITPSSYKFTDFDEAAFTNNQFGFYHAGRRAIYRTLTRDGTSQELCLKVIWTASRHRVWLSAGLATRMNLRVR